MRLWDAIRLGWTYPKRMPGVPADYARAERVVDAYQALYDAAIADDKYAITEAMAVIDEGEA